MSRERLFYGTPEGPAEIHEKATHEKAKESDSSSSASAPLSDMDFSTHVFALKMAAVSHLDTAKGGDQEAKAAASHLIDTLLMLREKTKGNLSHEESRFLTETIELLQHRFIKIWG